MRENGDRVFWSEPDASYIAIHPGFPGLSAFGPAPEMARSELEVALRLAVKTYREEGWELPESFRAPPERDQASGSQE